MSEQQTTDPPTHTMSEQQTTDPLTHTISEQQTTDPPTHIMSEQQTTDPPTHTISEQQTTDPLTRTISEQQTTDTMSEQQTTTDPPTHTMSEQQTTDPLTHTISEQQTTDPPTHTMSEQQQPIITTPTTPSSVASSSAEPPSVSATPVDRAIKVFAPPAGDGPVNVDLPDSFYEHSAVDVKQLYSSQVSQRQALENRPLKTKAIRDQEERERMARYPSTTIRIRFPDRVQLQATFESKEKVSVLYNFVKSVLRTSDRRFVLLTPPRTKLTELQATLYKAGLAPASVVNFLWVDKISGPELPPLSDEYLAQIQALSPPPESAVGAAAKSSTASAAGAASSTSQAKSAEPKKMPKWLMKVIKKT